MLRSPSYYRECATSEEMHSQPISVALLNDPVGKIVSACRFFWTQTGVMREEEGPRGACEVGCDCRNIHECVE